MSLNNTTEHIVEAGEDIVDSQEDWSVEYSCKDDTSQWDEGESVTGDPDDDGSEYTYEDESEENDADAMEAMDFSPSPIGDENKAMNSCATTSNSADGTTQAIKNDLTTTKKTKVDISSLDSILSRCNECFPVAVSMEDETFYNLVTGKGSTSPVGCRSNEVGAIKERKSDRDDANAQEAARKPPDASQLSRPKTSTLKPGVGYDRGNGSVADSAALIKDMEKAAQRQRALDNECCSLLDEIRRILDKVECDEGIVLLSLKMSRGLNRMLFSILKNESLSELGNRSKVYIAVLRFIKRLCASKFLTAFMLHDLLEGDGTSRWEGTSSCSVLLSSLQKQADILKQNQERFCSGLTNKRKCAAEIKVAQDIINVCQQIKETLDAVTEAIRKGREIGTISKEEDVSGSADHDSDDDRKVDPKILERLKEQEEIALYCSTMREHRFKTVPLVEMVENNRADHHFLRRKDPEPAAVVQPGRMLRITSELTTLSQDLPVEWSSSIFLRVDEQRPDIMKALIIAPEDTPYQNGVFEFDIMLPADYPNSPPKVHLVTTDGNKVRFNPNLYNCGKVCLSLLGTWSGPGWIPTTSTIFQVLVSIQSLIFVQDPYFNEPGYDPSSESQRSRSKVYDQQIRAATLKVAILEQSKKPPKFFEECIRDHFRLKKTQMIEQFLNWEELAVETGSDEKTNNSLVAGGGIHGNKKVVKDLCSNAMKALYMNYI